MEVLVADDDFVARKVIEKMLRENGHAVLSAENGRAAWQRIRENKVRMVITDWMMPEMDGPGLCRAVRKECDHGYVFIILLTAKDDRASIVQGLEAGADDYLTKPVHPAELVARIQTGCRILDLETSLQKANEEIRNLSLTDSLTGCYNRRYLADQLAKEFRRSDRCGHPLSIIMADIDHFKRINDTHGHPAGDSVLKEFAHRLKASLRKDVDWIARYGAEEFVAVLPETHPAQAAAVAERLRSVIAEEEFGVENNRLRITSSFGVSGVAEDIRRRFADPDAMIREADQALYRAKTTGRNRVVSAANGTGSPQTVSARV